MMTMTFHLVVLALIPSRPKLASSIPTMVLISVSSKFEDVSHSTTVRTPTFTSGFEMPQIG
jgi:hypothetical protein